MTKFVNFTNKPLIPFVIVFAFGIWVAPLALAEVGGSALPGPGSADQENAGTISLDFKEADINTVLRVLSLKSNVNIVAGPEVQGTVTIRLENVAWEKALDVVLRTYDYVYEREGNIIRVTTREKMAQEPVVTSTYILNYSKASEIQSAVQDMLTERGRIKTAERTNMIVITDIPTNLYRMGEVIKKLDRMTPQAFIDSKVIKTDLTQVENLGIEWRTGGGTAATASNIASLSGASRPATFPFSSRRSTNDENISPVIEQFFPTHASSASANPGDARYFPIPDDATSGSTYTFGTLSFSSFSQILQLLRQRINTKIVSNPRIVVLNNQKAQVQVGTDVPVPTFERNETTGSIEVTGYTYRQTGVVLNVTPHINSEEEILVELQPEVSSQGDNVDFGEFEAPSFTVTKAVTQLLIRSGETIAIGGLLTDNTKITEAEVPYFSDIPVFGKLFKSKRQDADDTNKKVETLFFVTVTMVDTEGQPSGERITEKKKTAIQSGAATATTPTTASVATTAATDATSQTVDTQTEPTAKTDSSDTAVPEAAISESEAAG